MPVDAFGSRLAIREDVNGAAWHNLGGFQGEKTAIETMDGFDGGIPQFDKRETYIVVNGEFVSTKEYALVRSETKDDPQIRLVGNCTANYNIVQPRDIGLAFDENVNRPIETLGFLSHGEKMFATWESPRSNIVVGEDDEVKLFGTILAGFDAKVAISISLLTFRVVCSNTFNMALTEVTNEEKSTDGKKGRIWVGHHNSKNILRDLKAWMKHVEIDAERRVALAENLFNRLYATPINGENVLKSLIEQMYPMPVEIPEYFPLELRDEKQEKIDALIEKTEQDRSEINRLFFGGDSTTNGRNAWDLFNNVTYYENHVRESKKDKNNSIVFGNRSKQMNNALSVLATYTTK